MSGLTSQHIRRAAHLADEEIRRRQRFGHPVPSSLRDLLEALNRAVSASGHCDQVDLSALKTTEQLASEWDCHPRTVRRKAQAAGGRKVHGWIFPEDT